MFTKMLGQTYGGPDGLLMLVKLAKSWQSSAHGPEHRQHLRKEPLAAMNQGKHIY